MWFFKILVFSTFFILTTSRHLLNNNRINNNGYGNGEISQKFVDKNGFMNASDEYDNQNGKNPKTDGQLELTYSRNDNFFDKAQKRVDTIWGMSLAVFIIIIVVSLLCCLVCICGMVAGIYYIVKKSDSHSKQNGGGVVYQVAPPPQQYGYQTNAQMRA